MYARSSLPGWVAALLLSGPLFSACFPLPRPVGDGALKDAVLDQGDQVRVVFQDQEGIKYGVLNGMSLASELVTSEGTLGEIEVNEFGYTPGLRGALALDPQGRPHVLYFSSALGGSELVHTWKESGLWESETITELSSCLPSLPSMAIDDSGDLHVTYAKSECTSGAYEAYYARRHEGVWSEEVVFTDSETYPYPTPAGAIPVVVSRISLGPDGFPVIAAAATVVAYDLHCSDASIRVAKATEGGGWEVERIFFFDDPCDPIVYPENFEIKDLSLALGSSGERAVGFVSCSAGKGYSECSFSTLTDEGTGWTDEYICGGYCDVYSSPCPIDGKAQDLAFSSGGQLRAVFTREAGGYPIGPVEQSISLASRNETGWAEETLWDNSLYPAELSYGSPPHLLLTRSSTAKILYNHGQKLMYLAE